MGTYEALLNWLDVFQSFADRWSELMVDDEWRDLPPDVCNLLMTASHAIADAGEVLSRHFETQQEPSY